MLKKEQRIALFAEGSMGLIYAKMTEGIIRYGHNPISAIIDSKATGKSLVELCGINSNIPIVSSIEEAHKLGAEVLILGTAPSGGRLPAEWIINIELALSLGLSIVNGLHDNLYNQFSSSLGPNQWIWDVRTPVGEAPVIGACRASGLKNTRVLMIGTDMAVGKMTAGLEVCKSLQDNGYDAQFLATGQTGICITGSGIPLDAYRVDYASGAVEKMVLEASAREFVIIEGQGSLLNPGSTATLPLMRGSCPTHMILCHRANQEFVDSLTKVKIPSLEKVISLNESLANALDGVVKSKVVAISLNTKHLNEISALKEIEVLENQLNLPVQDPVRFDSKKIIHSLI